MQSASDNKSYKNQGSEGEKRIQEVGGDKESADEENDEEEHYEQREESDAPKRVHPMKHNFEPGVASAESVRSKLKEMSSTKGIRKSKRKIIEKKATAMIQAYSGSKGE